jgi:hypothetical protein
MQDSIIPPVTLSYQGTCVRVDTASLPTSKKRSPFQVLRHWYSCSALRILVTEFYSLASRIRWSLRIRAWWRSVDADSIPLEIEPYSVSGPDMYRRAYISDMQRIQAEHQFLTDGDLLILAQAWLAGSKSGACTACSCIPHTQDMASVETLRDNNSMPLQATRKESTRDR